jgi:hypothetical protein
MFLKAEGTQHRRYAWPFAEHLKRTEINLLNLSVVDAEFVQASVLEAGDHDRIRTLDLRNRGVASYLSVLHGS